MHILNNIFTSDLKRIKLENGDVLHGIKKTDTGFIDFGDSIYAPVVNDLAISLSYALMGVKNLYKSVLTNKSKSLVKKDLNLVPS